MTIEERIVRLAVAVAAELPSVGVIGLGSGSTAEAVVRELGRRAPSEPGFAAVGVATSIGHGNLPNRLASPSATCPRSTRSMSASMARTRSTRS